MKIYVINITTTTKNKELYERVAVNERPLVIYCNNEERLKDILKEREDYIKNAIKTETLYNHALYIVREIDINDNYNIRDFEWKVKDVIEILFENHHI